MYFPSFPKSTNVYAVHSQQVDTFSLLGASNIQSNIRTNHEEENKNLMSIHNMC